MCITSNPAHLSKTKILVKALENGNHYTAYQNSVSNRSNSPNCMILPIPGRTSPELFHDTTSYNKYLKEIVDNFEEKSRGISFKSKSLSSFKIGQYTIGLCNSLSEMQEFLNSLPEAVQPNVSDDLLKFFAKQYPNWSFAICLFDSKDSMDAQPIAYEYKPFDPNILFYPTMDSHDGTPPKHEKVEMDHVFIFPRTEYTERNFDFFSQEVPSHIKSGSYMIQKIEGYFDNGDLIYDLREKTINRVFDISLV